MEALLPEKILKIQNSLRAKSYDEYREKYEEYFRYLQEFLSLKIWLSAPSIPGNDGDVILFIYYFRMLQDFLNHLGNNRLDTELKRYLSVFYLNNKDNIQYLLDAQKITEE